MQPNRSYVRLTGPEADIAELEPLLRNAGAEVVRDGGSWYFDHPALQGGDPVQAPAQDLVDTLRGLYQAGHNKQLAVGVQEVLRTDEKGQRIIHMVLQETIRISDSVRVEVHDAEGNKISTWPDDAVAAASRTGLQEPHLAKAARMLTRQGDSWTGLYKVVEHLQQAGLDPVKTGICTASDLGRFTHTANSVQALGDAARHAKEAIGKPKNPMSLDEAKAFVQRLVLETALYVNRRG